MPDRPNADAVARAVSAARRSLSPEDAAKIERLSCDRDSLQALTSQMSRKDWNAVNKVLNDPDLLRKVLASSQGKNALHGFLERIP